MNEPNDAVAQALRETRTLLATGNIEQARRRCEATVRAHPRSGEAFNLFGIVEHRRGDPEHALTLIEQAVSLEPRNPHFLNSRGIVLQTLGKLDHALASYDLALSIAPRDAQTLFNRGVALRASNRLEEALATYSKAIEAQPHYPEALINQGNVLLALKRFDDALASYNRALAKNPSLANGFVNRGVVLQALNRSEEALADYDRALAIRPNYPDALFHRGIALEALDRADEALAAYEKGLQLQPRSKAHRVKCGDVLQDLGRIEEAIETYRAVLATTIADAEERSLHDHVSVEMFWCERKICAWDDLPASTARAKLSLQAGTAVPNPFVALCVFDDAKIQLDCARRYSSARRRGAIRRLGKAHVAGQRTRVAYLSGDLHDHATSYLLAGVFEAHDRSQFDIRAYSYGPDDGSALRSRLIQSFDSFVEARTMSDVELAERIAGDEVDILVDLNGYTRRSRPAVLEFRPAPICVHYLGYPGTLGSPDVDYLIADPYVVPHGAEQFFSEAIVRLPGCYQANDDKREIADPLTTRRDTGLPEDSFVFCSFNRNYKITPELFDVWMRILRTVSGSVLWLLRDSELVEANLKREATRRGVDAQRLIFAPRVAHGRHLVRQRLADLFLDTWPVCAHTTASDALWAGLPLLTYSGSTFISRVAGSLLTAIGLPQLIAPSVSAYEDTAIALARDRDALANLRARLAANRRTYSLFDTKRFCRNLERAFEKMSEISRKGDAPHSFAVEASSPGR